MQLFFLISLLVLYITSNLILPQLDIDPALSLYFILPCLWLVVALLSFKRLKACRRLTSTQGTAQIRALAVLIGLSQILLYFSFGYFAGFGKNSVILNSTSTIGLVFYLFTWLAGMELSRAVLVKDPPIKNGLAWLFLISIFFFLLNVPIGQLKGLSFDFNNLSKAAFVWLPIIAESIFASFLVFRSGAAAAILFRGSLFAFWCFCPILPNLEAPAKCFAGVVVPLVGITLMSYYGEKNQQHKDIGSNEKAPEDFPFKGVIASICIFAVTWFASGLLPFYPLVVASGSMTPSLEVGDVVIVAKAPASDIKPGDILVFKENTMTITHRVTAVSSSGNTVQFTTRGDANNAADKEPVGVNRVEGKILFRIPKIGWLSLTLKKIILSLLPTNH